MIRKEFLIALSLSALLLGGCVDSSTGASAKADMEGGKATKTEVKKEAPKAEEKKVEAPKKEETKAPATEEKKAEAPKQEEAKAPATEEKKAEEPKSSVNTTACAGCHGANFEKKAMGVSKIVKDLPKDEIIKALKGYKDGSYGGSMKAIMKSQASALDDAKIEAIANKIGK